MSMLSVLSITNLLRIYNVKNHYPGIPYTIVGNRIWVTLPGTHNSIPIEWTDEILERKKHAEDAKKKRRVDNAEICHHIKGDPTTGRRIGDTPHNKSQRA